MQIDAFGLIEVRGLVTAIEASDAMLKSAQVRLVREYETRPGLVSVVVEGDLGACRAAVDAGVAAAARLGEVVSRLEIGRPDEDTEWLVMSLLSKTGRVEPMRPKPRAAAPAAEAPKAPAKPSEAPAKPTETPGDEKPKSAPMPPPAVTETPPPAVAEAPAPGVDESPAPKKASKKAAPAETPGEDGDETKARAAMLAFIAESDKGRAWPEIAKALPDCAGYRYLLEELVGEGALRKKGQRYLRAG
jgi:ethanolamine utilization protein EutK